MDGCMDGGQQPGRCSSFVVSGATEEAVEEDHKTYGGDPYYDKITNRLSHMLENPHWMYVDCTLVTSKM
jgi:hypothetical protein